LAKNMELVSMNHNLEQQIFDISEENMALVSRLCISWKHS
jgi:hypothetical protein